MGLDCGKRLLGVTIAVAALLLCFDAMRALGQGDAISTPSVVSLDGAAQLDTGFASVLSSGTLRMSALNYAPNAAQLDYRAQPTTTYQPMVQGANPTSFSLSTVEASRVPSAGDGLGFSLKRMAIPLDSKNLFPGGQRFNQRIGETRPINARLDDSNIDRDANAPSAAELSGLPSTSCLDLPTGCSGLEIISAPVIGIPVRHPTPLVGKSFGGAGFAWSGAGSHTGLSSWTGTGEKASRFGFGNRPLSKNKAATQPF
jgi:hypothetical protein